MDELPQEQLIKRAKEIVASSHLSSVDKKLIDGRIPFVSAMILKMFVEVCEDDPFGIDAIVKSFKKKLDAQGNLEKIHEIVKQERIDIEELLNAHAVI